MTPTLRFTVSLLFFAIATFLSFNGKSQNTCDHGRYINRSYFDSVIVDSGIVYGANLEAYGADTQILEMDVYQPVGDTQALRPLIIWAFGGSFISGDRSQVAFLCDSFSKMGYVTAGIDYRYSLSAVYPPNETNVTLEVIRAEQDMKAAVRYFKRKAAIDSNYYRVDTTLIIVGGLSAGAITADQAGYLTDSTPLPSYLTAQDSISIGGAEGYSGNQGYSSKVAGVISYSGMIGDTLWIQPGDAPIFMVHDLMDPVVPFGTTEVDIETIPTGLVASGDGSIDAYLNRIGGVRHQILTYDSAWHVDYLSNHQLDSVIDLTSRFLVDSVSVCKSTIATGIQAPVAGHFNVYPNPANNFFNIQTASSTAYNIMLTDVLGQVIYSRNSNTGDFQINTSTFASGIYVLKLYDSISNQPLYTEKLVISE